MTAHRLNRNEYTNTIRDLLGVRFRAEKYFPADDSGDGFDNIGDVLTVSPLLMERYLAAAERIAAWAISTEIPAKPIEAEYRARDRKIRRVDRSTIEAEHRVEFAGEYIVRFGLPGERPQVDGTRRGAGDARASGWTASCWPRKTVETKPSGLVYFDPYSEEELRAVPARRRPRVPRRLHRRRVRQRRCRTTDAYDRKKNKFLDSIVFVGPVRVDHREGEPQEDPLVRSGVGPRVRRADRHRPRAPRLPPPGDTRRDRRAPALRGSRRRPTGSPPSRASSSRFRRCWCRRISCSASSAIPNPRDPRARPRGLAVRAGLAAQLLPVELDAGRRAAGAGRGRPAARSAGARRAGQADAGRPARRPRSPTNFAGQWLETRNLDVVKPDPREVPGVGRRSCATR